MRTISLFLQLIGLFVLATLGFWVWFVNWGPNPNDRIGATAAILVPGAVKDWGCGKLNARFAAESPTFCSPVAGGSPPTPVQPNTDGSGRL
ncbi:hypothetical protein [Methylopila sp. M107]|uniref:hypothetical protein n=1 Tax=Methylopila sp. M107 TaxID=1101190 RepID=UPI00036E99B7|nr:hypothetical protein [Methylopila sp. M107]